MPRKKPQKTNLAGTRAPDGWSPPRGERWEILVDDLNAELPAIARTIAAEPHPDVHTLVLAQRDFDGSEDMPSKPALSSAERAAMFAALPSLTTLVLRGHQLFDRVAHPKVADLELVGHAAPKAFDTANDLPALVRLRWALPSDRHGVAMDPEGIAPLLSGKATPRLADLDLEGLVLDGDIFEVAALRKGSLPKTLRVLRLEAADGKDVLAALPRLERLVADGVDHEKLLVAKGIAVTTSKAKKKAKAPAVTIEARPTLLQHGPRKVWARGHHFEMLTDRNAAEVRSVLDDAPDRGSITRVHLQLRSLFAAEKLTGAGVRALLPALARLPALKTLHFETDGRVHLTATDLDALAAAFAPGSLQALELRGFTGNAAAYAALGRAIDALRLERLDLTRCTVPSPDALAALGKSGALRSVDLLAIEGAPPGAASGKAFAELAKGLTHLGLAMTMDRAGMAKLAAAVAASRLESLHVGALQVDSAGMAPLLDAIVSCGATRLVLRENDERYVFLDDAIGIESLDRLLNEGRVTDLTLDKSFDRDENGVALDAFIDSLSRNRTLTCLVLADLTFSPKQALAFARAIQKHPTLRELRAVLHVPDAQEDAFAAALAGSKLETISFANWLTERILPKGSVRSVDSSGLRWNYRPQRAKPYYAAAKASKTLERLSLWGVAHSEPADVKALLDFVANAPALRELDVRSCQLRPADVKALLVAIEKKRGVPLERLTVLGSQVPPGIRTQLTAFAARSGLTID